MGQHNNAGHDRNMQDAAKHSAYHGSGSKKDAPRPFHAGSPVGQPDAGDASEPKKDAPAPFNATKGKPFLSKNITGLSKGKTG